jgi:phenylacetate-CoA ligase
VTDLYSHEAPFIRYATGDIGVASLESCACGRPLPLLERLDGRSNDAVATADGRLMHGQSLISVLMEVEGIEQVRIHQRAVDYFHVQLVTNSRYHQEQTERRVRTLWSERLRAALEVSFEYLPSLGAEPNGKFRHIVSSVATGQILRTAEAPPVSGRPS